MTEVLENQSAGMDRLPLRKPMPKERFDLLAKEIFTLKKRLNRVALHFFACYCLRAERLV